MQPTAFRRAARAFKKELRRKASAKPQGIQFMLPPLTPSLSRGEREERGPAGYFFFFLAVLLADFLAAFFFGAGRAALGSASHTANVAPVGSTKMPSAP